MRARLPKPLRRNTRTTSAEILHGNHVGHARIMQGRDMHEESFRDARSPCRHCRSGFLGMNDLRLIARNYGA